MKMRKNRLLFLFVLLSLSVTMIFFIGSKFMYSLIQKKSFTAMVNNTIEMMEIIRDTAVETVDVHLNREKDRIAENALLYGAELLNTNGENAAAILKEIPLPEFGLDYLYYGNDGAAVSAWGKSDPVHYIHGLKMTAENEITMDGPSYREDGVYTLAFSAPIVRDGKPQGVLTLVLDGFCLSEWIAHVKFPSTDGLAYMVDEKGTNIAVSTVQNRDWVTTRYNAQDLAKIDDTAQTVADLEILPLQGLSGAGSYLWEGSRNYLVYAPVKDTGWGMFVGFYGAPLQNYAREITSGGFSLNQVYLLALVLILCALSIVEIRWIGKEQQVNYDLTAQKEAILTLQKKAGEQAAQLMEVHKTLLSSLEYAKKIQRSLLPDKDVCKRYFTDFSLIWSPKDVVGGDLYWIKQFSGGTTLCLCDCTGHGVPGALLATLVATALDAIVTQENYQDPAEIMWGLEQKLVSVLNARTGQPAHENALPEIKDGADLAILFVDAGKTVTFASGNTHVFVCNGTEVKNYKGQRLHIGEGMLESREQIKTFVVPAENGTRCYVASDGFYDQIGGPKKVPFGYRTLQQIVLESHNRPMDEAVGALWDAFEDYRGAEERRDDVELIGFQP